MGHRIEEYGIGGTAYGQLSPRPTDAGSDDYEAGVELEKEFINVDLTLSELLGAGRSAPRGETLDSEKPGWEDDPEDENLYYLVLVYKVLYKYKQETGQLSYANADFSVYLNCWCRHTESILNEQLLKSVNNGGVMANNALLLDMSMSQALKWKNTNLGC